MVDGDISGGENEDLGKTGLEGKKLTKGMASSMALTMGTIAGRWLSIISYAYSTGIPYKLRVTLRISIVDKENGQKQKKAGRRGI